MITLPLWFHPSSIVLMIYIPLWSYPFIFYSDHFLFLQGIYLDPCPEVREKTQNNKKWNKHNKIWLTKKKIKKSNWEYPIVAAGINIVGTSSARRCITSIVETSSEGMNLNIYWMRERVSLSNVNHRLQYKLLTNQNWLILGELLVKGGICNA